LQPDSVNRWYFKPGQFDLTEFLAWNLYNYQNNKTLVCKDKGIGQSEFVAGTQLLDIMVYFIMDSAWFKICLIWWKMHDQEENGEHCLYIFPNQVQSQHCEHWLIVIWDSA